jgi:hypothetical protein
VSPQDPDTELRSANSFTAPDTPNRTRSLKFRTPVCRHHHPLKNPFASFIFFHPLVSTPWELSVHIMLRSLSFYLILRSPHYSKEFIICSCFCADVHQD